MQKQLFVVLLALISTLSSVISQTPGMIVEPATGAAALILDPNSNGYVSATTAGFLGNDQLPANNELPWQTLIPAGSEPNSDVQNGPNCGFTDFVESTAGGIDPVFHLTTGGNWLFRFRMASIAPNAKSYSIMVDIDNLIGPGDDCYIAGVNPGFELEIVLATKFGVRIYDHRIACGSNLIYSYGPERIQKSIAASTVCSQLNFFLETYVSWADITAQFGVTPSTPMRYAIVDNMAADKSTICNPSSASDIGGVDDNACGSLEACFTQIVNLQPPCPPNSISPCIYSACPTISGTPIAAGATSISGTSSEANGTVIRIYVNGTLAGSGTVSGGSWTVSGLTPLTAGAQVSATAQATNEVESGTNCNNAQVAGATCTNPVTDIIQCNASKAFTGTAEPGAVIRLYNASGVLQTPTSGTVFAGSQITASTFPSGLTPATSNFLWRCVGSGSTTSCTAGGGPCIADGNYYVTAQLPGQCESSPTWFCVGLTGSTNIPQITTNISTSTTSVSGTLTNNVAENSGVSIYLYVNSAQIATTTTTNNLGAWTITVPAGTFDACDQVYVVAARNIATQTCPSQSTVKIVSGGITSTPTVNSPLCGTTTFVSGTVNEPNGTQIQVFSNGVSVGNTTSAGGLWELSSLSIPAGAIITAQATNSTGCESVSALSTGVTIATQTSNAVTITQNPLTESNLVISGTGTNGDLVTLYIDGWPLYKDFSETAPATAIISGGAWSVTLTQNTLYAGGVVTASVSNGLTCGSTLQDPTPVVCTPPSSSLSVSPDNTTICSGSVVTNVIIQNSQSGVIYQLYNNTLLANSGTSLLGNGGNITLTSAPISTNTTLNVLAIKSPFNGSCNQFLTENIPVTVAIVPTLSFVSQANPGCGATNGTITISGLGNNLTYTVNYLLNGTATSGSFTSNASGQIVLNNLGGGTYTNISTSAFGCNSTNILAGPFSLTAPIVPAAPTVSTTAATCSAAGTASITNYDGALTYTFTPAGPSAGAGGVITGITAGTSYTITAGNGSCTSIASSSFSIAAQLTTPSVPTVSTTAATCSAAGTATITNYDGALTYTFTPASPTTGAGGVITGMTAGTSYTVTAGNGSCTSAASSSFSIAAQLTTPSVPSVSTTAATCSAAGTATITNYDGALTYTFTPAGPTTGAGGVISGMTAGTSYTVTAGNGSCTSVASSSFSIAVQLTTPSVPTVPTSAATCSSEGAATITNYDGALTYTFTPAGPTAGAGGVITGMTAGTSYTVTAGNGSCTSIASSSFSIAAQLTTPSVPIVSTTAATCSAAGAATITNYDGALTYTFTPAGPTAGAGGVITGMTAGTSYTVTAGNGSCTSAASSSFSIAAQLTTPSVPSVSTTAATCSAAGTATITNYNGALTYTFTPAGPTAGAGGVISGMTAGTSYTVTAGNGSCTSVASSSFSIAVQLTTPSVPTVPTSAATCSSEGAATITNYDGALTYTFTPAGPTAGAGGVITGMTAGTSYTVTAGNGSCTSIASSSFSIAAQLTTPSVPIVSTTAATCSAAGAATITNYDGALTYTFTPAGPTAGAGGVITGMTAGTSYTVTAGNGSCTSIASSSFSIAAQLTTPSVPSVSTTAATCSAAGTATITNYDGALTYTFTPAGPTAGAGGVISGMTAGTSYTVTAGNGSCTSIASSSFSIAAQLTTPSVPIVSTTAATCSAAGAATITNYDGALTYTFTPAGPTAGAGGVITGMTAGTSYTVTAGNGSCTSIASSSFSIAAQLTTPSVPSVSTTAATCSAAGTATITNYDGALTYTFTPAGPTAGAGGVISGMTAGTSYTVTAGNGSCTSVASSSFSIAVPLCGPTANNNSVTTNEDVPVTLPSIQSNDTDSDGNVVTSTIDLDPTTAGQQTTLTTVNGTWSLNTATGDVIFTPSSNFNGTASINYTIQDNSGLTSNSASLTVTVNPVNDAPNAVDDVASTNEDTPVLIDVTNNDTDTDGAINDASVSIVTNPANGTVTVNPTTGEVTYTPNPGFNGSDSFTYSVCDNGTPLPAQCDQATVTITVNAVNDAPNAVDDVASTNEDTPVVIDVTNNDTDTDGAINDASVSIVTNPANGTVTVNPTTGEVTYTPNPGFNGSDSFTYSVCDNGTPLPAQCDQATVTLTVNAVNDAPNAVDDVASTNEDTPVVIDVTNNDTDTDGAINDASVSIVTNPANGTVTVNSTTGEVTYTPNAGFNGSDSFTYSVCDNGTPLPAQCDQATVTITVNAVNDAPNAADDVASTNEDTPVVIDVTNNDTDTDGSINDASVTIVSNPTNGTVTVNPTTGEVTYTPNAGFNGSDSFTYSVCDNGTPLPAQCDQATVTITVNAVNDAPNAADDVASTNEDTPVVIDVTNNDTDTDGSINDASVTIVSNPTNGTVTVNPTTGEVTYTPNAGFNGSDSFTYSVCDNGTPLPAECDQATVTVNVNAVNDPPVVDNDSNTIAEDGGSATGDLTDSGDSDPDGTTLTVNTTPVDGPNNGTITINSDGTYSYTPNAGFNGQDTIVVSVCDNGTPLPALCINDTLIITVTPINDDLNATIDFATTNENVLVTINVVANDTDSDGNIDESTLTVVDQPINGSVTINATTGQITYTPNNGFTGTDTLVYQICDDGTPLPATCDTAMVVINVLPCGTDLTVDCDGDGVTNGEEIDPDGDGTPGPNGTDPSDPCSFNSADQDLATVSQAWLDADCDGDGVTNGEEIDPDGDGTPGPNGTDPSDPCSFNSADQDLATVSQAWLDADCDGDGATNGEEIDPDGDGTPGPNGTDPNDPCSFNSADQDLATVSQAWLDADCDGDGVTNGEEIDPDGDGTPGPNGTDPSDPCSFNSADQDIANVSQAWLDADCDGDGATNGEEIDPDGDGTPGPNGTDPSDPCSFNSADQDLATVSQAWLDADCDGDGVTNGEEIDPDGDGTPGPNGTDPSDPCSFNSADQDIATVSQAWLDADCDGDGATNGEEIDPDGDGTPGPNGTDPSDPCSFNSADQDLATVSQAWLDADCDGDGVTNGEEIDPDGDGTPGPNGTDPNDPCSFNSADQNLATVSQAWLDADCDGDGVTNGEEIDPDGDGTPGPNGTDPSDPCSFNSADQDLATVSQAWLDADCDEDGVTNGEEIDPDGDGTPGPNGTDPSDPCSFNSADQDLATVSQAWLDADCDGDGATNGEEIDPDGDGTPGPNGTDPSDPCSFNSADQDLATVSQAWLDADCDGDGVTNGEEIDPDGDGTPGPNGTDPNDPCSFNSADQSVAPSQAWLDADCDGDGVTNGEEIAGGSDPLNPCDPNSCDADITIPQAFTPDGDNTNETFVIPGIDNYPKNKLTFMNRWGNEVFFAEGYDNSWDGTANRGVILGDSKLPTATYYYILDLNGDGQTIYKGYVYLKR